MAAQTTLRARKQADTREALHSAALRLFEAHGFEGTTVDQVASAAGVSRRTFFRYFESKEAVLFALQPTRMARFAELVERGPGGWESVKAACLDLLPDFESNADDARLMQRIIGETPALQTADLARDRQWEDLIAGALSADAETDAFAATVRAGAVVGALRNVIRAWRSEEGSNLAELATWAIAELEHGIARGR